MRASLDRLTTSRHRAEKLLHRIRAKYLEMPGLRLTLKQVQRPWGLDEGTCARSLDVLVEAKFLVQTDRGMCVRLTEGPAAHPPLRMAKTSLDSCDERSQISGILDR
jgi:DNA-binding IclR family transcriptional regulator